MVGHTAGSLIQKNVFLQNIFYVLTEVLVLTIGVN